MSELTMKEVYQELLKRRKPGQPEGQLDVWLQELIDEETAKELEPA